MRLALLSAVVLVPAACLAQDQPKLAGHKLQSPPVIDGTVDEKEWQGAPSFTGLYDSQSGDREPNVSTFWLAYDDQYIYFAAKLADPNPPGIKATEYRTNVSLDGDDTVSLNVEPFGNYGASSSFTINPRGGTNVYIAGGRAAKREWLGEILAKARITADGWEAEARIPWSIMSLPSAGPRDVLINVSRSDPRKNKYYLWRYTKGDVREHMGIWTAVEVPRHRGRRTIKLLPYGYVGWEEGEPLTNAGLDLKTSLSERLELAGTINPDFRNIENSILGLTFSYTEVLAGEARPFFQEGADYFYTVPFASQRIRDMDLGLKVFGKLNDRTSVGVMSTFDFGRQSVLLAGASTRLDRHSSMSAGASSFREGSLENDLAGVSIGRRFGAYNISASGRVAKDSVQGSDVQGGVNVNYGYKNVFGFANFSYTGPQYLNRLGYFNEPGIRSFSNHFNFSQPLKGGPIQQWQASYFLSHSTKLDGSIYSRSFGIFGNANWREGTSIGLSADVSQFLDNHDRTVSVFVNRPFNDYRRNWSLSTTIGQIAGEDYRNSSIGFSIWPYKRLQVSGSLQEQVHFSRSTLGILSWNYELGRDESLNGRLVRMDDSTNVYFAFRRSGNRGAEYFVILGDPNARTFRASLVLKVVFPFEF